MRSLSNITVEEFRRALLALGFAKVRTKGGHEAWMKPGLTRPIIMPTHVNPIAEYVVRNNLRNIGISRADFIALLESL